MREDVLVAWIEALRSGRYLQGRDRLRHGDRFSALGVLADVLTRDDWDDVLPPSWIEHDVHGSCWQYYASHHREYRTMTDDGGVVRHYELKGDLRKPPFYVVALPRNQWWGLTDEQQEQVNGLNDRFGYTHRRTADVLEREWLKREWYSEVS